MPGFGALGAGQVASSAVTHSVGALDQASATLVSLSHESARPTAVASDSRVIDSVWQVGAAQVPQIERTFDETPEQTPKAAPAGATPAADRRSHGSALPK